MNTFIINNDYKYFCAKMFWIKMNEASKMCNILF